MPAVHFVKRWNVGTDDFAMPALLAMIIRFISIGLTVGVLIYLFVGKPEGCPEQEDIPPFLYGSLFALLFVLLLAILNENIIFSISLRGSIIHNIRNRRWVLIWILIRFPLFIAEFFCLILCTVAVFGPAPYGAGALKCPEFHNGPIIFAKVMVVCMLIVVCIYFIGSGICIDPLEVFTPHFGWKKLLRTILCLNSNKNRSRTVAMQEMAEAIRTVFTMKEDKVTTDVVAGLILLSRFMRKMRRNCVENGVRKSFLHQGFCDLIFSHVPHLQWPDGYQLEHKEETKVFDPNTQAELQLLDDMVHYMKYSMGIYGWSLHVFDNLCKGPWQICSLTCCRCNYSCCHEMTQARENDVPIISGDNCCMAGLAAMKLQTGLEDCDILHMSLHNEYCSVPFSICADRAKRKIVLTVRGTLSIKDAMTDITAIMQRLDEEDKSADIKGTHDHFVHTGMYEAAKEIRREINEHQLLTRHFEKPEFRDFGLVLTGHSLGAGVASILSVLLRREYPNLECYAFSPPGCVFSFSLAWHSKKFIHSVVLGNDMIPRSSFQSLLFLKWNINKLLQKCQQSKFRVLFCPRLIYLLPQKLLKCFFKNPHDIEVEEEELYKELEDEKFCEDEGECVDGEVETEVEYKVSLRAKKCWIKLRRAITRKDYLHHIHGFMQAITVGKRIAAYPPGKILHINVEYSRKPWLFHHCFPDKLEMHHVNGEDLPVILVERGMIEDHLPNNVLAALLRCQEQAYRDAGGTMQESGGGTVRREGRGSDPEVVVRRRSGEGNSEAVSLLRTSEVAIEIKEESIV